MDISSDKQVKSPLEILNLALEWETLREKLNLF